MCSCRLARRACKLGIDSNHCRIRLPSTSLAMTVFAGQPNFCAGGLHFVREHAGDSPTEKPFSTAGLWKPGMVVWHSRLYPWTLRHRRRLSVTASQPPRRSLADFLRVGLQTHEHYLEASRRQGRVADTASAEERFNIAGLWKLVCPSALRSGVTGYIHELCSAGASTAKQPWRRLLAKCLHSYLYSWTSGPGEQAIRELRWSCQWWWLHHGLISECLFVAQHRASAQSGLLMGNDEVRGHCNQPMMAVTGLRFARRFELVGLRSRRASNCGDHTKGEGVTTAWSASVCGLSTLWSAAALLCCSMHEGGHVDDLLHGGRWLYVCSSVAVLEIEIYTFGQPRSWSSALPPTTTTSNHHDQ